MLVLSKVTPSGAAQDVRLTGRSTAGIRFFPSKDGHAHVSVPLCSAMIVLIAFCSSIDKTNAQSTGVAGKSAVVASPEEATGAAVRDFNALRVLDHDYLNNPDGGETPLDEDDLWFPDMALARKDARQTRNNVRVITYNGEKTTTETRTATAAKSSSDVASKAQNNVAGAKTQQTSKQPTPSKITTARHDAPSGAPAAVRQTSGFADYQPLEGYVGRPQGFEGYAPSAAEPAYVAMKMEESLPQENTLSASEDDFPSAEPWFADAPSAADVPVVSLETPQLFDSSQFDAFPTMTNAPINPGLDALLSNVETTAPVLSNATLDDFPTTDSFDFPAVEATDFPETDFPDLGAAVVDEPAVQTSLEVPTPSPTDVVSQDDVPLVASASLDTPLTTSYDAEPEDYRRIDYLAVPEADHTLVNGDDEPFRESFSVASDLLANTTKPAATEKNSKGQSVESAPLSEADLKKLIVSDVRISGLEMTAQQFNKIVRTRIGARFNQQRLEEDKRALLQTRQFIDVAVSTSWSPDEPDKVVVNFDLTPRRLMRYIKVVGNRKISKHDILEELGLRPGESRMDPYEVENGRLRIIEYYKSKDYGEPYVAILKGDRPGDVGVVYLVCEGLKQRVLHTKFVGNTVVSSARLRSLVSVKPGVLYFIGGTFTRERLDADVQKLLEYYRNLGYFDARIDREYEEGKWFGGLGKDNAWVSVCYIINEGPRYKIRNFTFNGNRVLPDSELAQALKVKKGSFYRYDEIEADRIALRYLYQDIGYIRADITPNQVFTDEVGVVDIRYDVSEDHRYRASDVVVDYVGHESRTMTPVVLNMLDIVPGEVLNGKKIRMSENTLRQSGYFNDKPSDGQLPEIAVVPDESRSYRLKTNGRVVPVGDSNDAGSTEKNARRNDDTTRGQSGTSGVTRGQSPQTPVPHTSSYGSGNAAPGFISYGPGPARTSNAQPSNAATPASSTVRGQSRQVPSGFSPTTTLQSNGSSGGYQSYDSTRTGSQFTDGLDYANGDSANLLNSNATYDYSPYGQSSESYVSTDGYDGAPGFSDGVYGSIGKEILEPITPETDDIYDGAVLVKVQEGRTGVFQASIGVNSDYGLVGNVSLTERNFNLFRPPTALFRADGWQDAFRGGGQIFNIQASPGTKVQSYRVSWDVPNVFNTRYLFGVTGLYGDHSFDEWFEARYGGELRVGRQWTPRFSTTVNAGIYNVKIKDPAVGFVPDLNEVLGTNRMYNVGLTATYDTRNHPYSPSAGFLLKGTTEVGLGDYTFPRVALDGRYYKTLHQRVDGTGRWVVGLSSHLGWTGDKTPIYERYYGGGSQNLRGFEYREVTPRYLNTGFGVGGNFELYNTVELLVPVSGGDEFQFAFFVDSGTVSESIKKWGRYRVAPGVGLRFSIPMLGPAPLALDFAFPVSKDPNDVTEVFTFSLSGSR